MLISSGCSFCGTKYFLVDACTECLCCTCCSLQHSSYGHFVEYENILVQFNGPQGTFIHIGAEMDMDIERGIRVEGLTKTQLLKAIYDFEDFIEAQGLRPPEDWDGLTNISPPAPIDWSD